MTSAAIAEQIEEQIGLPIDKRKIKLDEPVRLLGAHQVPVGLASGVSAEVTVVLERVADAEPEDE